MKLRNKKTGEIKEVIVGGYPVSDKTKMWECSEMDMNEETGYKTLGTYTSLAELNEEWEDYEESKEYCYIDYDGEIYTKEYEYFNEAQDNIGNRFETKEEAEKAVEKLKAWKRLKEAGFRTYDICQSPTGMVIHFDVDWKIRGVGDDLDLLFEGNDESSN